MHNAVVKLRIRGVLQIGSTFVSVLEWYPGELRTNGKSLILLGIKPQVMEPLRVTGTFIDIPEDTIFRASDILGESTSNAIKVAEKRLKDQK